MDQPDFAIKNIVVSHQFRPDTKGSLVSTKVVTFSIGDHGPFTKEYPGDTGTAATIKADILAQQQELRSINEIAG